MRVGKRERERVRGGGKRERERSKERDNNLKNHRNTLKGIRFI